MSFLKKYPSLLIVFILIILIITLIIAFPNRIFNKSTKKIFPNTKKEIINTDIVKSSDSKYLYMNSNSNFQAFFPQNIFDLNSNIKFQKNQSSITFNLLPFSKDQKNINPQLDKNQIYYSKIYQNGDKFIDLKYTISPDKLSEEIILNQYQDLPKISQKITLFNSYISQNGQQLNFLNPANDESLWFIPAPFMYEKNNPSQINYGLTYEIICDNPKTELKNCRNLTLTKKLTAEGRQWLANPSRHYPVVIDPSLQINNADTYTSWVSSNTSQVGVSQDTVNKTEGTGSVKVTVGPNLACWGTTGPDTCNSDCTYTSVTPSNVYTTCTANNCAGTNGWGVNGVGTTGLDANCSYSSYSSGSVYSGCSGTAVCAGTNGWGVDGVVNASCLYSGYTGGSIYSGCGTRSWCSGGFWSTNGSTRNYSCSSSTLSNFVRWTSCGYSPVTVYLGSGSCSSSGSGSCYVLNTPGTYYYTDGSCDYYTYYASYTTCSWVTNKYTYPAINAATAYWNFTSPCASSNSGSCYILNGSSGTRYTDGGCGSSSCTTAGGYYYSAPTTCTWVNAQYYSVADTPVTGYWSFTGACASGTGNCYKINGSSTNNYINGACNAGACSTSGTSYKTAPTTCNWVPLQETHTASVGTTRYVGVGTTCAPSGTGSCYLLTSDASNTYTGNTGCASGSDCGGAAIRKTATACTWLSAGINSVKLTQSATNLSSADNITFWVRSSRAGSGFLQFSMGEINHDEQVFSFDIGSTNTWEQKTWDISNITGTARDAITKFAFIVTDAGSGFTFNFDDIQTNYSAPTAPLSCLIDQGQDNSVFTLKWANNSIDKNFLSLYKQTDGGSFVSLSTLPPTATTFPDTNVSSGHTYTYKLNYYITISGTTVPSDFCYFPTLNVQSGSLKFDGVKLDGLQIN